ncbi:hypothetical protein ACFX1X_013163 [Malus domestica]
MMSLARHLNTKDNPFIDDLPSRMLLEVGGNKDDLVQLGSEIMNPVQQGLPKMDKSFERVDPLHGGDDATHGRNLNAFGPGLAVNDHRVDFMLPEAPVVGEKLDDEACLAGRKECTITGHLENLR